MKIKKSLQKRIVTVLTAGMIMIPGAYGLAPAPVAHAEFGWGSIIGAGIQGAAAHAQLTAFLKKYNDSEEGRQEFFEEMKKQYGVNNDAYYNNKIDTIMANLTAAIGAVDPTIYDKPYNYFINQDQSFNAFCTIGHNMSINTGLFSILTNDDEIAVVLGHEMAHGQKDHPAKGARRSLNMSILGAATGTDLGAIVAGVINNRNITKPMEREADALAFEYITHSNYNPGACAAVWQRVMDKSKGQENSMQQFFSDHPSDGDRRDAAAVLDRPTAHRQAPGADVRRLGGHRNVGNRRRHAFGEEPRPLAATEHQQPQPLALGRRGLVRYMTGRFLCRRSKGRRAANTVSGCIR